MLLAGHGVAQDDGRALGWAWSERRSSRNGIPGRAPSGPSRPDIPARRRADAVRPWHGHSDGAPMLVT